MDELGTQFSKEQDSFEQEVSACTEQIKNDVQCALEAEQDTLTEMAMNQQNINGRLNQIVRNAVTVSVKKRFMPLVEKYLRRVAKCINSETLGDLQIQVHLDVENLEKGNLSTIVAVATGVLMGMPILGILTGIFMKLQSNKKREEARQRVSQRLQQEIFPQVLQEVGKSIKMTISEQVQQMNTSIEQELTSQKALLEKAMADVRGRIDEEKSKKENLEAEIKADLERIGEIKDGL